VETEKLLERASSVWESDVLPTLETYVRIPNLSPQFAPDWKSDGHMDRAADLLAGWCRARPIDGVRVDVVQPPGLTPSILVDVPGHGAASSAGEDDPQVLLYGHMDKQPEFTGWREGLGPWDPVLEDGHLYGRGTADDGYAVFCALTAIEALRAAGGSHARCLVLIEGSEESGSPDLPATLEAIAGRVGGPRLVVALDTGCATYDRLWCTESLRGLINGTLEVRVLSEGVHSGSAGGVVPSSFRIARMLLSRVEDEASGEILLEEMNVPVPTAAVDAARSLSELVGEAALEDFPVVDGLRLTGSGTVDRILSRTWKPSLSVIGAEGLPDARVAGNVLRPYTALELGFRLPPTCDAARAAVALERALTADPPYGAEVSFEVQAVADGWAAPSREEWLSEALAVASKSCYGLPWAMMGEGGTIPFLGMLNERFPGAQIVATGVLGPGSNAHGPNEFLDLAAAMKLSAAIGVVLEAQSRNG